MRRELLLLIALSACTRDRVYVFTAASMEEPIRELAPDASINAAASSSLARQIEAGAQADLFVSADREWADHVAKQANVLAAAVVARNRLVLIAPTDGSTRSIDALLSGRLALADPTHVPAGKYAKAALEKIGEYREVSIAAAADVRAALAMVERGEADAGVVYAIDARLSNAVRIVSELECPLPLEYVAVLLHERGRRLFDR